ncbi:hypothetical protein CCH79_00019747 [Gambusia affinis]|uniref:Uncharacterized protein n=1 Tax=Gambusia affinis TaxID=33528 RepID=A0A315VSN1_GAMAF|nr:hypothetical protein CCH79_00019747 [Gambusia affinis]
MWSRLDQSHLQS